LSVVGRESGGANGSSGATATLGQDLATALEVPGPAQTRRVTLPHMEGLDGLRGIGMLAMLGYHNEFGWARGSFLALSMFFTLSGFLITSLLIREFARYGGIDLAAFWWRRFRRLAPAALLALAFVVLYGALAAPASQRVGLAGDIRAAVLYSANWRMLAVGHSYAAMFSTPSAVQHFWSLAVEEQFYFIFPLITALVFIVTKGSLKAFASVLGVLALASLTMELVSSGHDRIYYGTDTRAAEFLIGALLAVWMSTWKPVLSRVKYVAIATIGLIAFVVALWAWSHVSLQSEWLYEGGFVGSGLISAIFVTAAITPGPVRTITSFAPFRAVGLISYGLYLFHWPVYLWLDGPRTGLEGWSLFVVRMVVTFAIATASYYLVEQPIRTGRALRRARTFWPGILGAGVAVMVAAAFLIPVPPSSKVIDSSDFANAAKVLRPASGEPTAPATPAPVGVVPKPLRVFVVGDSIGMLFSAGLEKWGEDTGLATVASDAFLDCPLARGGSFRHNPDEAAIPVSEYCNTISDQWQTHIARFRPDVIIVMGGGSTLTQRKPSSSSPWYTIGDPTWDKYLRSELDRDADLLSSGGVPVLWADQYYIQRDGGASAGKLNAWSDPVRANRYNKMVEQLDAQRADVVRLPWARFFNRMSDKEFSSWAPDGVHIDAEGIPSLLEHEDLWKMLEDTYLTARAQLPTPTTTTVAP
jgi:peptidoglycan/LPS O-acetylase OafA/YrhL